MRPLVLAIGAFGDIGGLWPVPGSQVSPGDYKLYVAASTSSSSSFSHRLALPLRRAQHAARHASPDWTHLYTVKGDTLVDLDPLTGATRHSCDCQAFSSCRRRR